MHEGSVHLLIPTAAPILLPNANNNNTHTDRNNVNNNQTITNNFANNSVNTPNQLPQNVNKNSNSSINNSVDNTILAQGNTHNIPVMRNNNSSADSTSTIKKPALTIVKPPNSFMLYSNDMRAKLKTELPDLKQGELVKIIGARWKSLHPDEKAKYAQLAAELLAEWKTKHPDWEEALKQKRQESAAKSKKRRAEATSSDLILSDSSNHSAAENNVNTVHEPARKKRKLDSARSVSTTKNTLTTASLRDSLISANNILNNISLFLTSRNQSIPIARPSFDDEDSQSQDSCQNLDASRKSSLYTNPVTRCFDEEQTSDSSNEVLNDNSVQYVDTRAD
jgi:hypothetical protein